MSKLATRFAFSTIMALDISDVQTSLFNWLYSKNKNETFQLRIEDSTNKGKKNLQLYKLIN